jgi:hypothetical protein
MTESGLEELYSHDMWDGSAAYLAGSRILLHNDDYLEFLVKRV